MWWKGTGDMRGGVIAVLVVGFSLGVQGQTTRGPGVPPADASLPAAPSASATATSRPEPASAQKLPEAPFYTPLTGQEKFHIFLQQTYSPFTFANTAFDAGWAQMTDDWPAYGQGAEGYGKRYGALLANHEAGSFFENFFFPTLFRQDPRYFREGPGHSLFVRVSYAASRVLVTRSDSGHNTFNASLLLGLLFVDSLTNAYYPRPQRGFDDTMSRFGGGLLSSAQTNLLREFWPDISRVFHKHEPERLKRLEELEKKMPLADKLSRPDSGTVQPDNPGSAQGSAPAPAGSTNGPSNP